MSRGGGGYKQKLKELPCGRGCGAIILATRKTTFCPNCRESAKKEYSRKWDAANDTEETRAKKREWVQKWREGDKGKKYYTENAERLRKAKRDYVLRTKFGITLEEYELMVEERDGRCDVCQEQHPLVVDHCHSSGVVRGLLCRQCNAAMGKFGDTVDGLMRAVNYLKNFESKGQGRRAA